MSELYDADAVSEVLAELMSDPLVLEEFGGVEHISGLPEGPWPHLVVSPGSGGSLGAALAWHEPDLLLEVVGPVDGTIGPAALWRLMMIVVTTVKAMPERDHVPGRPVVSAVKFTGGITKQPLASGQIRWQATAALTIGLPQ